jgi:predicted RNase H-like HicB family nuclease
MFDFTKQTKQYEELAQRIKEVNEFWFNAMLTATKELFNVTKTK